MIVDKFLSRKQIFNLLFFFVVITLPFSIKLNSFCIILLCVLWLSEGGFKLKYLLIKDSKVLILLVLFYLLYFISLLYTENISGGFRDIEKKTGLFILPIIIATSKSTDYKRLKNFYFYFTATISIACVYCMLVAFYNFNSTGEIKFFFWEEFASALDFHPVYFSFYIIISIFSAYFFILSADVAHEKLKYLVYFLILLNILALFLLSSKIMIFWFLLCANVILLLALWKSKKFWQLLLVNILLVVIGLSLPGTKSRFQKFFNEKFYYTEYNFNHTTQFSSSSIRFFIWSTCLNILQENRAWVYGIGPGDVQPELTKKYLHYNIYPGDPDKGFHGYIKYNAHNQFIETFIGLGFVGLVILLFLFYHLFKMSVKDKVNFIFFSLFFLFSLSESVLNREKGIIIFSLFIALTIVRNKEESNTSPS